MEIFILFTSHADDPYCYSGHEVFGIYDNEALAKQKLNLLLKENKKQHDLFEEAFIYKTNLNVDLGILKPGYCFEENGDQIIEYVYSTEN